MERRNWGRALAFLGALTIALPLIGTPKTIRAEGPKEAETLSSGFRKAAKKVLPAVVTVRAGGPLRVIPVPEEFVPLPPRSLPRPQPAPGGEEGGSGVIIDAAKGYVLTNDHVSHGAFRIVVVLHDGRERPVHEVRRDPRSDLALLVIDPQGLTQADWGDSDSIEIGDWVLAIGQPFGLSGTVTAGIISGKGRGIGDSSNEDLIQTDAAINPGNSGGPLVDLDGRIIGINTLIKTRRGGNEGVGFAVPASRARRVAADLASGGSVRRAYLGVSIGPVDPATAERLGQSGAVIINGVSSGSPAEAAGLKAGDILTRIGGRPLRGLGPLQSDIEFAEIGAPIVLTVRRDGKEQEITARPEALPDRIVTREVVIRRPDDLAVNQDDFPPLGFRLSEVAPVIARRFRLREGVRGLVVTGVTPDGPADQGGIEIGMVITDLAGRKVETLDDARKAVDARARDRDLLLRVFRGPKAEFRVIPEATIADRPPAAPAPVQAPVPAPSLDEKPRQDEESRVK